MSAALMDETDEDEFPTLDEVEEVKPARRTRQSKPRDPNAPRATRTTSDAKLAAELMEPMAMLGQAVSFMSPTGGAVIIARGENTTTALVKFAKGHPKMLAALRNVSKVSPAAELIQTLAMVIIAIQIDVQAIAPDTPIAQLTGVTSIHQQMVGFMTPPPGPVGPPAEGGGGFSDLKPPPPLFHAEGYNDDGTWEAPPGFMAGPSAATLND